MNSAGVNPLTKNMKCEWYRDDWLCMLPLTSTCERALSDLRCSILVGSRSFDTPTSARHIPHRGVILCGYLEESKDILLYSDWVREGGGSNPMSRILLVRTSQNQLAGSLPQLPLLGHTPHA